MDAPRRGRAPVFAGIGFLGGFLGGLLGVGGGFILVPLQVLWGGLQQRQANANSLIAIIPIAIAAVPIYYFRHGQPQVDFRFALFLVAGAVVGAYIGARSLKYIPDQQLKIGVAILILVLGVKYLLLP